MPFLPSEATFREYSVPIYEGLREELTLGTFDDSTEAVNALVLQLRHYPHDYEKLGAAIETTVAQVNQEQDSELREFLGACVFAACQQAEDAIYSLTGVA